MVEKPSFSFEGWNLAEFAKGRKKLLITVVGAVSAFVITNKPEWAAIVGAVTELAFAVVEYYVKEREV